MGTDYDQAELPGLKLVVVRAYPKVEHHHFELHCRDGHGSPDSRWSAGPATRTTVV
jgi:hypothetical protein